MSDEAPQRTGSSWPIVFAVIAIALIAFAGFIFKSCIDQPNRVAENIAKAAQSQVTINTIIQTSLQRLREESKLVIYTADISVMVTKFSEKKVLYGKLDLGTTTVRLRASGNKAQIVVPLNEIGEGDFQYDEVAKKLIVTLPAPKVDETVVEVQTDPTYYEIETDIGWARLDGFSGDFLREQARRDLRPAVIFEASQPRILKAAEESGRQKVAALLEAVVKPMQPETSVAVEFKPPNEK
jgi:hypothetical protein